MLRRPQRPWLIRLERNKKAAPIFMGMEYKDIKYTVVQGIERRVWKWSVSIAGIVLTGQKETRSDAVAAAEKAIDRALAPKKVPPVPPGCSN